MLQLNTAEAIKPYANPLPINIAYVYAQTISTVGAVICIDVQVYVFDANDDLPARLLVSDERIYAMLPKMWRRYNTEGP